MQVNIIFYFIQILIFKKAFGGIGISQFFIEVLKFHFERV